MQRDRGDKPFGDWLLDQIEMRDWTIAEFARHADVARQTAQKWVRSERRPDPASCYRIATALGLDPDVVLDRAGHREDQDVDLSQIDPRIRLYFLKYRDLPPRFQRLMLRQIEALFEEAEAEAELERRHEQENR